MIALLISLADFPDFVPFSVNIDPLLVNPHIRDAQNMDLWPLLPQVLRVEIAAAAGEDELAGGGAEFYGGEFYMPSPSQLTAMPSIVREYIRPLLILESARRMLPWHGAHVTPNGTETISDIGHAPISSQQRAELKNDLIAKANFYRSRLEGALRTAYPNTATCSQARTRPRSGGLQTSAI